MHDNAGELTKCIAVSSRHLDNISHPLCLALTKTERATSENKRALHKYLHDSQVFTGGSFRVFVKYTTPGGETINHNDVMVCVNR